MEDCSKSLPLLGMKLQTEERDAHRIARVGIGLGLHTIVLKHYN